MDLSPITCKYVYVYCEYTVLRRVKCDDRSTLDLSVYIFFINVSYTDFNNYKVNKY